MSVTTVSAEVWEKYGLNAEELCMNLYYFFKRRACRRQDLFQIEVISGPGRAGCLRSCAELIAVSCASLTMCDNCKRCSQKGPAGGDAKE